MARPRPDVLVVDDDPATRDGLTMLLASWGYKALSVDAAAENGPGSMSLIG